MGFSWMPQRRYLFLIYILASFTVLIYIVGYSPNYSFKYFLRWSQVEPALKTIPCVPRKNIVFLKTHKCASTSVQNILMRYAHKNDLTLVIPVSPKSHYFSLVKPFRKEMVAGAPWELLGYNIFCHHMVFNKPAVTAIMPEDSIYLSIVRHPVNLFESLYEYDELQNFYHMDIEEYARGTKNESLLLKLTKRYNGLGRNQMLYDFGLPLYYFRNRTIVENFIKTFERMFDFVMIAEYFDESVVLLRHILCWDLDDVISLTINARLGNFRKTLSAEAFKNLEEWNWADKMLYDIFLKRFQTTVKEFGPERLELEVQELRRRRSEWFDFCVQKKVQAKNLTSYNVWSNKVAGYVLKSNNSNQTCEDLVKPEKYFTSEIRQHQLIRSILKGATLPNYGPISLKRMLDLKFLKDDELLAAKSLLVNQFKFRRKFTMNAKKHK